MLSSTQTIDLDQLQPLRWEEKETVKAALIDNYKIYAVASAVLRTGRSLKSGALALVRKQNTSDRYFLLIDLRDSSGSVIEQYFLSEHAELTQTQNSIKERHCVFADPVTGPHVDVFFADRAESLKLHRKFSEVFEQRGLSIRVEGDRSPGSPEPISAFSDVSFDNFSMHNHSGVPNADVMLTDVDNVLSGQFERLDLNKANAKNGKGIRQNAKVQFFGVQLPSLPPPQVRVDPPTPMAHYLDRVSVKRSSSPCYIRERSLEIPTIRNKKSGSGADPSMRPDPIPEDSIGSNARRRSPDQEIIEAPFSEATPNYSPTRTDVWTCTIHNNIYEIPDVTNSLMRVNEAQESEDKIMGGFGVVRRGYLRDGTVVAIKTLFASASVFLDVKSKARDMKGRKRFKSEAAMHSMLSHPNILPMLGIAELESFGLGASLVLPWMENKDSLTYVQQTPGVRRLPLILGSIAGIAYLHDKGVIHGDIKGRNILISNQGTPLLCDFGLASLNVDIEDRVVSKTLVGAGSAQWMALELHLSESPGVSVTKWSDMWAFGMVVIELLTGNYPFPDVRRSAIILIKITGNSFPPRPVSDECPDRLWELVQDCWKIQPSTRPTAQNALKIIRSLCPITAH